MTHDLLLALVGFATVATVTPGPNNVMVMTSGANYGFRRTLPHMLGIAFGFGFMVMLVGLGLARIFTAIPQLKTVLTVAGIAYLLYLAWKIAHAAPPARTGGPDDAAETGKPLTFLQAAAFQWVNPKGWQMAITAITLYAADNSLPAVATVSAVFFAVCFPCVGIWTIAGQKLRRVLSDPKRLRAFNWTMAALLVASLALLI